MGGKTIVAFVLIMVIFLFYPTYMKWLSGDGEPADSSQMVGTLEPPSDRSPQPATPAGTASPGTIPWSAPPMPAPVATTLENGPQAKTVEVVTPLYKAVFTSRGANLIQWELTKFAFDEDNVVSMIRNGEARFLNLELTTGAGPIDLGGYNFTVNRGRLDLTGDQEGKLVFELTLGNQVRVIREYTFYAGRYDYLMNIRIEGGSGLLPETRDYRIQLNPGLRSTETDQKTDRREFKAISFMGGRPVQHSLGDVKNGKDVTDTGDIAWAGLKTKYFLAAIKPREGKLEETRTWGDAESLAMELRRRGTAPEDNYLVYMGPLSYDLLKSYEVDLEEAVNLGWRWIRPISHLILSTLSFLHGFIPNYGLVIIIFSIFVKILFYPLSLKSLTSMKRMQMLQPQIADLRGKHKKNPQQLNKAMMSLYKTNQVNPMGGCLPMLLQLPVFIALYAVLYHNIEMRGADFMLWIEDLSRKDPYYILPILMGITMFVQQKMTAATDPRQAMMTYIMPIIFTWFFLNFPSGLVLYWFVTNLLQIAQQKMIKPKPLVTVPAAPAAGGKKKK